VQGGKEIRQSLTEIIDSVFAPPDLRTGDEIIANISQGLAALGEDDECI
jgi:hypothetical protein